MIIAPEDWPLPERTTLTPLSLSIWEAVEARGSASGGGGVTAATGSSAGAGWRSMTATA
jgi:hypothetical protein